MMAAAFLTNFTKEADRSYARLSCILLGLFIIFTAIKKRVSVHGYLKAERRKPPNGFAIAG
jgi:hypothetical protein